MSSPTSRGAGRGLSAHLLMRRGSFELKIDLEVSSGTVLGVVGPNGAGKSTLFAGLAGLLPVEGTLWLGDRNLAELRPAERRVAMVFQDYLLFAHLSVLDNVAFGPRVTGLTTKQAREAAHTVLGDLGLTELAHRKPPQLSGGQAQRVALARALASEPELILLDEPLSALDAATRLWVRSELKKTLDGFGGIAIIISHDVTDVLSLVDEVAVLESGKIVQRATPSELLAAPASDFVAALVGQNLLRGEAHDGVVSVPAGGLVATESDEEGPVNVLFTPSSVALYLDPPHGSPRNMWAGDVARLEPHGRGVRVSVAVPELGEQPVVAEVTTESVVALDLRPGAAVWLAVKASAVTLVSNP